MLRLRWLALLTLAFACNAAPSDPIPKKGDCDEALRILAVRCTECHKPQGQVPALDKDGAAALSPDLLAFVSRKVSGTQADGEGARMPPGVVMEDAEIESLQRWIDAGAPTDCEAPEVVPDRHHPLDWADPARHGLAFKLADENCRDCHAQDFTGFVGPSCDSCHKSGWRTNCTYCHGNDIDGTGAPPRDINGEDFPLTFIPHTSHVSAQNHAPFDCVECHAKPTDVTSMGHVLDGTAGRAEVDFSGGRSSEATYNGDASCSNLWCHGNGQGPNGSWSAAQGTPTCDDCHNGPTSNGINLSGAHRRHLREGFVCADCHAGTIDRTNQIVGLELHVNRQVDLQMPAAITRNAAGHCSGVCHGESHSNRAW